MTTILTVDPELLVPSYYFTDQDEVVSTTLSDGSYVLVWKSSTQEGGNGAVYAQRFDASGHKVGGEFKINTYATSLQSQPSVTATLDGGFVVTWSSYGQDGSYYGIYGQKYTYAGVASGGEFHVSTFTDNDQMDSHVTALAGGGFLVVWTSVGQDDPVDEPIGEGVYAQRYTASGLANGAEFRVNTVGESEQNLPVSLGLADGGFIVAWSAYSITDATGWNVVMKRYNVAGTAITGEIIVNSTTAGTQLAPAISALEDGGFVVAWSGADGLGYHDVFAQRYDADGVAAGAEIHINTTVAGTQSAAQVTGLSDGGFVVTWMSSPAGDFMADVYTQRFDAEGNAIGIETRVNTYTVNTQELPTVTALADGGYTVAWSSFGQDGSGDGVYQRTFRVATSLAGAQTLYGSVDNDILDGGSGADKMYGGLGDDTYYVNSASDVVSERSGQGTDTVISSLSFNLNSIAFVENLVLTGFSDITGSGNAQNNVIVGNAGWNTINAGNGNDQVYGEGGNDELIGLFGDDSLYGGAGNDELSGYDDNDHLDGGDGNDIIDGGNGDDFAAGGEGGDLFYLSMGNDHVDGGGGGDYVSASAFSWANINLNEGWAMASTGDVTELLDIENAIGSAGNDSITGSSGANLLIGGGGADKLNGGSGNDTYVVDGDDVITEATDGGIDLVRSSVNFVMTGIAVENLKLLDGAVSGTGNNGNNTILGNNGNNLLNGGIGADVLEGGAGFDTYVVDNAGDIAREYTLGGGHDLVQSSVTFTLGTYIEDLQLTGSAAINGTGNESDNYIIGNSAANVLTGGLGADTYIIQNTDDNVVETDANASYDVLYSFVTYTLSGRSIEVGWLQGSDNINLTGNGSANSLIGNIGNNLLSGAGGHDYLDGDAGADTMDGGSGNDTFIVDSSGDSVVEASGGGTDIVYSNATFSLNGLNVENLVLTGSNNINGTGGSGNNIITGNYGLNTLNGGGGNDVLTGGALADIFLFQAGFKLDTIMDFNSAEGDKIQLSGLGSYTVTQSGTDVLVDFGSGNVITVITDAAANVSANIIA
ncbi:hypothetical protein ABAC460_11760 [Asticcacaulis sp. AC460]|uniref:calcium-binding protein n=1 Tax=Asticcacaulis sp. AC460 TaxID=1282360 RepID=UPI0003C3EAD6|nr:calcium-binding protein [Asticcacaulis sp. AC460]ESQ89545.1 hypothetical protein ABAC460_11760 [Asticcacaulis sp. AC460]